MKKVLVVSVIMVLGVHGINAAATSGARRLELSEDAKNFSLNVTRCWGLAQAQKIEGTRARGQINFNGILGISIMANREELQELKERVVELERIVNNQRQEVVINSGQDRPELEEASY